MTAVKPWDVPGWKPGIRAALAEHPTGALTTEEFAQISRYVTASLAEATPHIRAEVMADLSDEFADDFPEFAAVLDNASAAMRSELAD